MTDAAKGFAGQRQLSITVSLDEDKEDTGRPGN